jgi:hypothetical protein
MIKLQSEKDVVYSMDRTFWQENLKEGDHLENPGIGGRMLNWILKNRMQE